MLLKNIVFPALILGAGILGMSALLPDAEETQSQAPKQPARMVTVQAVELGNVAIAIEAYGRLASQQPISLISEVEGKLQPGEVPFLSESTFKAGQVLLKVDDRPLQLRIKSQKSALLNALARTLPEIRIEYPEHYPAWQAYFDKLGFETQLPDLPAAQNGKIKLFLSRFDVYSLYFAIRDLEILQEKHIFRAPFDGVIRSIALRQGATVRPGSIIAELLDMERIEVAVALPANQLRWVDTQAPVSLKVPGLDKTWSGKVLRIGKTLDTETQTLNVYVAPEMQVAPKSPLFEGMFLEAHLTGKTVANAIEIPLRLLYGKNRVFLVKGGKLEARTVEVGYRSSQTATIVGGLQAGEQLVTDVLQGAVDGMPVAVKGSKEQS